MTCPRRTVLLSTPTQWCGMTTHAIWGLVLCVRKQASHLICDIQYFNSGLHYSCILGKSFLVVQQLMIPFLCWFTVFIVTLTSHHVWHIYIFLILREGVVSQCMEIFSTVTCYEDKWKQALLKFVPIKTIGPRFFLGRFSIPVGQHESWLVFVWKYGSLFHRQCKKIF